MTDHAKRIAEIEQSMVVEGEIDVEQARYLLDRVAESEKVVKAARRLSNHIKSLTNCAARQTLWSLEASLIGSIKELDEQGGGE